MSLKRLPLLLAVLLLLTACQAPQAAEGTPAAAESEPPIQIDWLHGFYAVNSRNQLDYTAGMDAVSVGWAQLEYAEGIVTINDTTGDWVKPLGADEVMDFWQERSIPCNLNVYALASTFNALTADERGAEVRSALCRAARPYAGLTIDFEGLREGARSDFSDFMTALRSVLPENQTLYVCVPPDTWYGGYDYHALGEVCDKVILMAHDYQWTSIPADYVGGSNTYSPLSPLDQVEVALRHVTDPGTGVGDVSKVAIQIAFNSCGFHVDEDGAILDATLYHPATVTIARRLAQNTSLRVWDEKSGNPSLWYYTEDGSRYHLWYEDAQSVTAKLKLAARYGVTGVSIWRLGIIPDYPYIESYHVWQVLTRR